MPGAEDEAKDHSGITNSLPPVSHLFLMDQEYTSWAAGQGRIRPIAAIRRAKADNRANLRGDFPLAFT